MKLEIYYNNNDAKANLALAVLNYTLTGMKLSAAAAKAAANFETAYTGFYADVKLDLATTKTSSNSTAITNVASIIEAGNDITLTANLADINQKGSHISSENGDIIYNAKNINLDPSKDKYNFKSSTNTENASVTLASTNAAAIAIDALSAGIGFSNADNSISSTTYNNSTLTALNGKIEFNASEDANIISANLVAKNIDLNIEGNLTLESKQNEYHQKGESSGMNLAAGTITQKLHHFVSHNFIIKKNIDTLKPDF